jgi:hypothetical protein
MLAAWQTARTINSKESFRKFMETWPFIDDHIRPGDILSPTARTFNYYAKEAVAELKYPPLVRKIGANAMWIAWGAALCCRDSDAYSIENEIKSNPGLIHTSVVLMPEGVVLSRELPKWVKLSIADVVVVFGRMEQEAIEIAWLTNTALSRCIFGANIRCKIKVFCGQ